MPGRLAMKRERNRCYYYYDINLAGVMIQLYHEIGEQPGRDFVLGLVDEEVEPGEEDQE